ncbi:KUP/HAK/KT family potassium transporter [Fulvivirgaceae bacterium PWU4]|uniref:Probable potassium transport system protein Kup n=1 Tax=Chryseosolibacter histidini TaxID=2782349 RepID=A0AAP2DNU8_9BACT|nr:KUP/HAK/KT family potassium transporter [Chryseosolibacter histidini]MBT1699770.1 KUP/HAK/KT family potassium transporter [Chryseosolibacter histidini]
MAYTHDKHLTPLSTAGVLISLGIIYGDIGTSPIYTFRFIVDEHPITEDIIFGGLSCVFWTLTLITTIKYVYLALSADNKGEGGIFALYALVRRYKAGWVIFPAIIGCATLISDGFITPAISVTSAIEGLRTLDPNISSRTIITIVVVILVGLFIFQQFGSGVVGRTFGPIMLVWFSFIAVIGFSHLMHKPEILQAINPVYAFNLLVKYPGGFWILGAVFLCTTGAEAMYSDLGHVGKGNIRVGWGFVKVALLLSYFGQGAYLLEHKNEFLGDRIPFFEIMPDYLKIFGIILATMATIIASQALISGTFTLVNEAMKLKLWPSTRVRYPSTVKGQIYVPAINWILMLGCILVVLIFKESQRMEGAYGLAITFDMLMTTSLLVYYFSVTRKSTWRSLALGVLFFSIEGAFLISNLNKFAHGGWFSFTIASLFFIMMYILLRARRLRERHTEFVDLKHYVGMIQDLQADTTVPKEATNLVYLAMADSKRYIDSNIIYSIFKKRPKRADVYWFVHVDTVDNPFTSKYVVDTIIPKKCFFVRIKLGFKTDHRVNLIFNKIIHEMADAGEIDLTSPYPALHKYSMMADFKFIILHSWASSDSEISNFERLIIQGYRLLKANSLSTEELYGIEAANLEIEKVPIQVGPQAKVKIKREKE